MRARATVAGEAQPCDHSQQHHCERCTTFPPLPLRSRGQEQARATAPAGSSLSVGERWLHRDSTFGVVTLEEEGQVSLERLNLLLAKLLWEPSQSWPEQQTPPEVLRAKGIFNVAGSSLIFTLQAVRSTYVAHPFTRAAWAIAVAKRLAPLPVGTSSRLGSSGGQTTCALIASYSSAVT